MNKLICQKCNQEISNEFGVTLVYCTNCGAKISLQEVKTIPAPMPFLTQYNQGEKVSLFDGWVMSIEDDDANEVLENWQKILGIILLIVAVTVLPFFLAKEFKEKKTSEIQRTSSPTPESSPINSNLSQLIPNSGGAIPVGVLNSKAINLVQPQYSPAAKATRASGEVNVQVVLDENGKVISVKATSGEYVLRPAAETAARASKFNSIIVNEKPAKVTGIIVYNFTLP